MPKSKNCQSAVPWRPDWKGEDLEKFHSLKARFQGQVKGFKELRRKLGLSQIEAAERLATTQSNVSKIEAKSDLSMRAIKELVGEDGDVYLTVRLKDGGEIEVKMDH